MANSKYNQIMFLVAEDLGKLVSGKVANVDLANFKLIGARKQWSDSAEIVADTEGKVHVVNSINAHTIAIGDVLGALGYKGPFFLNANLLLSLSKAPKEVTTPQVTLADILAKIAADKAAKAVEVTEPAAEVNTETEHVNE